MRASLLIAVLSFLPVSPCVITADTPAIPEDMSQKSVSFDGYVIADSLDYSAESIRYLYSERKVVLRGNASVSYQGHTLKSGEITYYQDFDYLEAVGIEDSTGTLRDTPVFTDPGGQEMRGLSIEYNLRTEKGFIRRGRTEYESGYMAAERIKRAANDTLYISNGTYTTCDIQENPHYYFAGKRMKFILNDKLIIKPIVGYLHDIPVFWFPFYVFPIKKGRQSGFLMPRYGSSRRDGRYFSNLGYYFAPSDYIDYKVAGTLRERNGWYVNNWFNYNKRYSMSGSVFGSWENREDSGEKSKQYKLRLSHRQTVTPELTIDGSGRFESSTYSQYNSRNLYERLNRDMRSTLTITKRWRESGRSLITTTTYTKNLDRKTTETSLPNISFTMPRKLLFGSDSKEKAAKYTKIETGETTSAWYNTIYYSFNTRFNNSQTKREDSSEYNRNLKLSTSLSSSQKFMGWLVSEPSVNLNEDLTVTNSGEDTERYRRLDNISMGLRLGTTVYGMFSPSIGSLTALRHVITPSVSYSYGKNRSFYDEEAVAFYRFDRNEEKKGKRSSMSYSLRNLFQAKTVSGDKENKIDLFSLDFSGSVDFEQEKRKMSSLRTTFDFKPIKVITTRLTASHDFYNDDDSFHPFSPTLDDLSITTNVGLTQKSLGFMGMSARDDANARLGGDDFDIEDEDMPGRTMQSGPSSGGGMFNLRFSHTYGLRRVKRPGKDSYRPTHTVKPELSFSPSAKFSVRYYCYYNIEEKNLVDQRILISRDLHCWEANLSWVPAGYREGFYFKVNIKDLPDVKIEERRGSSGISY